MHHPNIRVASMLHASAEDLQALVANPGLLEHMTAREICELLRKSGYAADPSHGMGVTIGWGRKLGDASAPTSATLYLQKEDRFYALILGSKGYYALVPMYDMRDVVSRVAAFGDAISSACKTAVEARMPDFTDRLHEVERVEGFYAKLIHLFPESSSPKDAGENT